MLFVPEEDVDEVVVEDPVIKTIPLYLNMLPDTLRPLLVQSKSKISPNSTIQYKQKASIIEVETPLSTEKFFSQEQAQNLGSSNKALKGVIINNDVKSQSDLENENLIRSQPGTIGGSQYFALLERENGIHMSSIQDTVVLNPDFTHIDDAKNARNQTNQQQQQQFNQNSNTQSANGEKKVNIVTMSAKGAKEILPRLGGALLSSKLETEEDPVILDMKPSNSEIIESFICNNKSKVLTSSMTQDEYLNSLLDQSA